MPVTKNAVVFKLTVDSTGAVSGLKMVEKSTKGVGKTAKAAAKDAKGLGLSLKGLGISTIALNQATELLRKTTMALNRIWDATIARSLKLEKNIAEITTLISDSTGMNEKFTESILKMQEQFGTSQADAARSFYDAISSGAVDATTANELLINANKLAIGGVTTLTVATGGLTSIINAYGLAAKDALRVSDALFLGMKFGTTTIEKLSLDLGRVTGLAASTGTSFQELIAATAAITTGGVRTSEAITQMRSAFVALNKQSGPMQEVLKKLGIENIKLAISQRGLIPVLKAIRNETDGSTEALTRLFGRVEAMVGVIALTSNKIGPKYVQIMKEMGKASENVGVISQEAFDKIAETLDFQLDVALGGIVSSLTRLGNVLKNLIVPILIRIINLTSGVITVFASFVDVLVLIISEGKAATVVLIGWSAAALAAAASTGTLTAAWISFTAVATIVGAKLAVVSSAVRGFAVAGLAFAAVTAGVVTLVAGIDVLAKNMSKAGKVFELFGLIAQKSFVNVLKVFTSLLLDLLTSTQGVLISLGILSDESLAKLSQGIQGVVNDFSAITAKSNEIDKSIADIGSELDLGFAEQLLDKIREAGDEIDKVFNKPVSKEAERSAKNIVDLTKEQLSTLRQISQENAALEAEIAKIGATRVEIIKIEELLALDAIDLKEETLRAEEKLTAEALKRLNVQRMLVKEKSERKTEEVETPQFFNPDMMSSLTQGLGSFAGSVGEFATAALEMAAVPLAMIEAANMLLDFVQKLLSALPDLINKLADTIDMVRDLPEVFNNAFKKLFKALETLIPEFVSKLFTLVFDLFETVIPSFIDAFIEGIADTILKLPDMIVRLLTKSIPMLIAGIIKGLLAGAGKLAVSLLVFLIKGIPKILKGLDKMVPIIAKAIGLALIEAFREIASFIMKAFSDSGEDIGSGLVDAIKGSSKDVFAVLDLEQNAAAVSAAAKIKDALMVGWGLFTALWAALEKLWKWVWGKLTEFWDKLTEVWRIVFSMLEGLWNTLRDIWLLALGGLQKLWDNLDALWKGIWSKFDEKVIQPLKSAFSGLFDPEQWKKIGGDIWEGLKSGLGGIADFIKNAFKGIDNPLKDLFQVDMMGTDKIEGALGIDVPWASFAGGGVVPGSASVSGNHISNDTIPALLSPDEVVIPRSLTQIPEVMAMLKAIMSGKVPKMLLGGTLGEIESGLTGGGEAVGDLFEGVDPTNVSIDDIESLGDKTIDGIKQLAAILSPGDLLKKMADRIFSELISGLKRQTGFENGGPVTSTGPAFVHEGEFVLSKNNVSDIRSAAAASNNFDRDGSQVNQDFQINVNVAGGESIDEGALARSIMDEIKEASIQGRFIMSEKGLRVT